MYKLLIFIVLTSAFLCVESDIVCTKHEILVTCVHEDDDHEGTLQRGSVSDDENIEEIYMSGCKLSTIEAESFENIPNLVKLDLSKNLLNVTDSLFGSLVSLKSLNLSRNLLTELSGVFLTSLGELETLDLSNNRIKEINSGAFDHTPKLQHLYLSNNLLDGIQPEVFIKLTELIILDLSKNVMSSVTIDVFDSVKKLNILDLSSCKLSPIPDGIFDQLTVLTNLYLASNDITEISTDLFEYNAKLRILDLADNKLTAIGLNVVTSLTGLKILNVSKNQLSDASFILSLPQLSTLDLSNNKLQSFPTTNSTLLRTLDISSNRFTNLGMSAAILLPRKLVKIGLHRNPWQCTCLEQIATILQRRNVSFKDGLYFNGKKPVCIIPDKPARCAKDAARQAVLYEQYEASLKKYA